MLTNLINNYSVAQKNYAAHKSVEDCQTDYEAKSGISVAARKKADEAAATYSQALTDLNKSVTTKFEAMNAAQLAYNTALNSGDESLIANAKASYDKAVIDWQEANNKKEAELAKLDAEAAKAETEAQNAEEITEAAEFLLKEAETLKQVMETAKEALLAEEDGQAVLDKLTENPNMSAEDVVATVEAEKAAATEEIDEADGTTHLTEEEALSQDYIIIKTAEDLAAIDSNPKGKYILMNDIDLSGVDWIPLGLNEAFKGVLNGNGYKILNMSVTADPDDKAIGLFAYTNGAKIENLILENAMATTSGAPVDYSECSVGLLIGESMNTTLADITVSGTASGYQGVGGVVGCINDKDNPYDTDITHTTITNVNANVDVNAGFYAGGLVGEIRSGDITSLAIENCTTSGDIIVTDQAAGGLIGEAGKCVVTVNNCSSSINISKGSETDTGLVFLDNVSRIGGIIGNCNGTYIAICNSEFTGTLNCEDEFKGENYGWYMNDAQVTIYELSAGLPVDDILLIDGVEALQPKIDPATGVVSYEITVSTEAGMNKIVDMIKADPTLSQSVVFNVQFDFEAMDEQYDHTSYSQYGVVQHLYEEIDENGDKVVVNDVYFDNEIDVETTFNTGMLAVDCNAEPFECKFGPDKTMVEGLYKHNGKYYISTPGTTIGEFEGFTEVSLEFFYFGQKTNIEKRLESDETRFRSKLVDKTKGYQQKIYDILAARYGLEPPYYFATIEEPEYKALKKKELSGATLTNEEKLKIELFELNYTIAGIVADATRNEGCGMGGDASFLEKNKGIPLKDEEGRVRWMNYEGLELRQSMDENGEPVYNEDGTPVLVYQDGKPYEGDPNDFYKVRGFAVTDENGNFLYNDTEGNTVVRTENEDGTYAYSYEDGTKYEGNPDDLEQQLEEQSPADIAKTVEGQMQDLVNLYNSGGKVEIDPTSGKTVEVPPADETNSGEDDIPPEEEVPPEEEIV